MQTYIQRAFVRVAVAADLVFTGADLHSRATKQIELVDPGRLSNSEVAAGFELGYAVDASAFLQVSHQGASIQLFVKLSGAIFITGLLAALGPILFSCGGLYLFHAELLWP